MTSRIACCVPFCRRTRRNEEGYTDWICAKHWALVPKVMRRLHSRAHRAVERRYRWDYWREPAGSPARIGGYHAVERATRLWRRCKRKAIERAAGI